jgi:hypothetical protein
MKLIEAAKQAGIQLYGDGLVFSSTAIKMRGISDRVQHLLDNDVEPEVAILVDDYEYAFSLDGVGIEASGDAITDERLKHAGLVLLYDPEFGVDVLV